MTAVLWPSALLPAGLFCPATPCAVPVCLPPHNPCAGVLPLTVRPAGEPGKGRRKNRLTVCFFIFYCSPLFTIRKKISNTVS
ncbi:hypothetical protein EYX48_04940 [Escherichia coli]|nr:hypothetical protein [Escherichia coli]EFA5248732.1 hypothetical protein [Escherichia coli]